MSRPAVAAALFVVLLLAAPLQPAAAATGSAPDAARLVDDALGLLLPPQAAPAASRSVALPGPDGALVPLELSSPVATMPDERLVLQLPPEAGRKVDPQALDLSTMVKDGVLTRDGKVPVIVRVAAPLRADALEVVGGFARLDLVVGKVPLDALARLALDPGVERVFLDGMNRPTLAESVPLVRAPEVWARTDALGQPVDGRGVVIAILDTGVDHTHPDLGGCLGAGCKVIAAKNFAAYSPDASDDHGHGTHVAATAAAVAPGASLLNYKVLSYGGGFDSWIIAGIENATLDGARVISMSLGGPGTADGPMAQAVDWAVAQGAVVVSAAGNDGCDGCIGEPGSALSGIAVGATTKGDALAWFSSRGPVYDSAGDIVGVKPDVAAPGVEIRAAVPTGGCVLCSPSGYASLSGTSMATPHVSGAAALLMQAHPGWTPDDVKAALVGSAVAIDGASTAAVGGGRIDALAALDSTIVILPSNAWLGLDLTGPPTWSTERAFVARNLAAAPATVALSADLEGPIAQGPPATGAPDPTPAPDAVVDGASVRGGPLGAGHTYDLTFTNLTPTDAPDGFTLRAPDGALVAGPVFANSDTERPGQWNVTFPEVRLREGGEHALVAAATVATVHVEAGIPLATITPSSLVLAPGASGIATLSVTVPNDLVADGWIDGDLRASAGTTAVAKLSLLKSGVLHLTLPPSVLHLHYFRDDAYVGTLNYPGTSAQVHASAGAYDFFYMAFGCPASAASCGPGDLTYGMRELVAHADETVLDLRPSVTYASRVAPAREDGTPLPHLPSCYMDMTEACYDLNLVFFSHPRLPFVTLGWGGDGVAVHHLEQSGFNAARILLYHDAGTDFVIGGQRQGIDGELVVAPAGAPLERAFRYEAPHDASPSFRVRWCNAFFGYWIGSAHAVHEPRTRLLYDVPDLPPMDVFGHPWPSLPCFGFTEQLYSSGAGAVGSACWQFPACRSVGMTPVQMVEDGAWVQRRVDWTLDPVADVLRDGEVVLQAGASHVVARVWRGQDGFRLYPPLGLVYPSFFSPASGGPQAYGQDWIDQTQRWRVLADGVELHNETLHGQPGAVVPPADAAVVELELTTQASLLPFETGSATYRVRQTAPFDGYFARFVDVHVADALGLATRLDPGAAGELRFRIATHWSGELANVSATLTNRDTGAASTHCCLQPAPDGLYSLALPDVGLGTVDVLVSASGPGYEVSLAQTPAYRVAVPNAAPQVQIVSPSNGETLGGSFDVRGTASDPDGDESVRSVFVSIDGGRSWSLAQGTTSWSHHVDADALPDGPLTILARASDGEARSTPARVDVVLERNAPPRVTIDSPAPGSRLRGATEVAGRASDPDGDHELQWVRVSFDDGRAWYHAVGTTDWRLSFDTAWFPPGPRTILVEASDGEMVARESVDVEFVDNGAPWVAIDAPRAGDEAAHRLVVSGRAGDPDGDALSLVEVRVDAGPWRRAAGLDDWGIELDVSGLEEGAHTVFARATDGSAWSEERATWFLVKRPVDDARPTVAILSPASGAVVEGTLVLSGEAHDAEGALESVEVRVDGGAWLRASGLDAWSLGLDTTLLAEGVHTIDARASDASQTSTLSTIWVVVDNVADDRAPSVAILAPAEEETVSGLLVARGVADDPEGALVAVELRVDEGPWTLASGTESWSLGIDTTLLADGVHTLQARASDGTSWSPVRARWFVVENAVPDERPRVSIGSPASGSRVAGVVTLAGTASDAEGALESVEVRVDGGAWVRASGLEEWSLGLDTTLLSEGVHTVDARALDAAQASPLATIWLVVDNVQDGAAPTVRIVRPAEGALVAGVVLVEGTASDDDGEATLRLVEVSLDRGATWLPAQGTAYWAFRLDTTALPEGPLALLARASDGELLSELAAVNLTVHHPPPPPPKVPDLALVALEVEREPLTLAGVPVATDAAERRLVRVTLENAGDARTPATRLDVRALAQASAPGTREGVEGSESLGSVDIAPLEPGRRVVVELRWDVVGNLGEQRVVAEVDADGLVEERDEENNRAERVEVVLVGGAGGVAFEPLAPPDLPRGARGRLP